VTWYKSIFLLSLTLIIAACMPVASPIIIVVPPTSTLTPTPTEVAASEIPVIVTTATQPQTVTPTPTISGERTEVDYYVVKEGDKLSDIAERYNLSPESILFSNFQVPPDTLDPGTTLLIPPIDGLYYTWQEGESLPKIAHRFDVSILSIVNWQGNNLGGHIEEIQPGTTLFIPGGKIHHLEWSAPVPTHLPTQH
jgi:LysM repeat protein